MIFEISRPRSHGNIKTNKDPDKNYVALKTPPSHGQHSECSAIEWQYCIPNDPYFVYFWSDFRFWLSKRVLIRFMVSSFLESKDVVAWVSTVVAIVIDDIIRFYSLSVEAKILSNLAKLNASNWLETTSRDLFWVRNFWILKKNTRNDQFRNSNGPSNDSM